MTEELKVEKGKVTLKKRDWNLLINKGFCYSCGHRVEKDRIHGGVCRGCWDIMSRIEEKHRLAVELLETYRIRPGGARQA